MRWYARRIANFGFVVGVTACSTVPEASSKHFDADVVVVPTSGELVPVLLTIDPLLCIAREGPPQPCNELPYFDSALGVGLRPYVVAGSREDWPIRPASNVPYVGDPGSGPVLEMAVGVHGTCARPVSLDEVGEVSLATKQAWTPVLRKEESATQFDRVVELSSIALSENCTQESRVGSEGSLPAPQPLMLTAPGVWLAHLDALVRWILDDRNDEYGVCLRRPKVGPPGFENCFPPVFRFGLDMGDAAFDDVPVATLVDRFLDAAHALFDTRPQWAWTHTLAAPGFPVDIAALTRAPIDGGPSPRLRAFLTQAKERGRMPQLGLRVTGVDGAEIIDAVQAARELAVDIGWASQQPWWRTTWLFSARLQSDSHARNVGDVSVRSWRRGVALLVASLLVAFGDSLSDVLQINFGTVTATDSAAGPTLAEMTTSGEHGPEVGSRWRSGAWPALALTVPLSAVFYGAPLYVCLQDPASCPVIPPSDAPIPSPARRKVVIDVAPKAESEEARDAVARHVVAHAIIEKCIDESSKPAHCFDRADRWLGVMNYPQTYDLAGDDPSTLLRVYFGDERGIAEGAVGPSPSPTVLRINMPAGVKRAWWRVSTMPPPGVTFLVPPMTEPAAVEVVDGKAELEVDAGRPGGFLLEMVW